MKDRIIGGFFVATITLITLLSGGIVTACILTAVSIAGLYEFMKLYKLDKTPFAWLVYLTTLIFYGLLYFGKSKYLMLLIILLLMVVLTIYVVQFPKYRDQDIMKVFFGFVYITVMLSYVYRIRSLDNGILLAFYILIASWGNDVFAYLVGSAIGKHPFSPKVSPHKSVEGFIGGILGAGVIGFFFAFLLPQHTVTTGIECGLIAAAAAIPAVIGDLAASAIKRNNDIKDYSHLIPGHGGILDRFDSVFFTAPIIYYLVTIFQVI